MRQMIVPLLGVALLSTGCQADQSRELQYRDVQIAELETEVGELESELAAAQGEIATLRARPPQVITRDPAEDMRRALAGSGANAEWRNGELVISINNEILFRPGSATLTRQAQGTLDTVARAVTRQHGDQSVRVEGHTDNQPIRRSRNTWEDNWHLAGGRARAVLHYLVEKAGMDRERLSFAGYADTRPVTSNSSKDGQARNRRVEIIVLPR